MGSRMSSVYRVYIIYREWGVFRVQVEQRYDGLFLRDAPYGLFLWDAPYGLFLWDAPYRMILVRCPYGLSLWEA